MNPTPGPECLCPLSDTETIVAFNRMCPDHGWLASKATEVVKPWCSGSSERVQAILTSRTGRCVACRNVVSQKHGHAAVHLRDGSTPRE